MMQSQLINNTINATDLNGCSDIVGENFKTINLNPSPAIMGILNLTPDSFSDGGKYQTIDLAIEQAFNMIEAGASIIDIGGESSNPHSAPITLEEELQRLKPVLPALIASMPAHVTLSVDTYKPKVMQWALNLGVGMINDIYGFSNSQSLQAVQGYNCKLCVMHMQGSPQTMQLNPNYEDVVKTIHDFFMQKLNQMQTYSIDISRIILDVGFGFGKSMQHNIALLKNLQSFKQHEQLKNFLMLVGVSNKRFIGYMTAQDIDHRMLGNAMAHLTALQHGADIIRVHDVNQAMQVKRFYQHLHNFVVDESV